MDSHQNVTDDFEGREKPRLNNGYMNIENVRAENFESLDSELINSHQGIRTGTLKQSTGSK